MAHHDPSLSEHSLFGSISWAAMTLGMTKDNFIKKRDTLEREGFPSRDPLTNLYLKDDLYAWVSKRRTIADRIEVIPEREKSTKGVNTEAL